MQLSQYLLDRKESLPFIQELLYAWLFNKEEIREDLCPFNSMCDFFCHRQWPGLKKNVDDIDLASISADARRYIVQSCIDDVELCPCFVVPGYDKDNWVTAKILTIVLAESAILEYAYDVLVSINKVI